MKNLKKVIFALMVVFLVVGFIGCKTETDPTDPPAPENNFIGTWMMDDLSAKCVITKDAFTTYVGSMEFPGTYTLNEDNKSAVAKFMYGGEEQTVDMALLEGETDVAEMDLSSFGMGESIFVKYREGEFDIVGTWSDGTLNIVITNEGGYTVTAVADPTNATVSEGTVSKEGNTFTLVENGSSDEVSTGVLSTNGKAYCNYYEPISGDWISAPFTKN